MENKSENVFICPRCKQILRSNDKTCINCGYDLNAKVEEKELLFGMDTPTTAISIEESSSISYIQDSTLENHRVKTIQYITVFVISILAILFCLLPLFPKANVWYYVESFKDDYQLQVNDCLAFSNKTILFGLIKNVFTYIKNNTFLYDINIGLVSYEGGVVLCVIGIVVSGVILLIQSIKLLFFHKQVAKFRDSMGMILIFSLILVYGFGCYGFGPIFISAIAFLSFLYFYISDIVSKEKKFILKHLIIKVTSLALLLTLLALSSVGYVKMNIATGANLISVDAAIMPDENGNVLQKIIGLKGFMLEFSQLLQTTGTDEKFSSLTLTFSRIGGALHIIYLVLITTSIVAILRSMSNPSVKFPLHMISYAMIAFVGFIVFVILFKDVVNEAMIQKYIDTIGNYEYEIKSAEEKEQLAKQYSVYYISKGLNVSIIMSIPTIILSVISRNILLNRNY